MNTTRDVLFEDDEAVKNLKEFIELAPVQIALMYNRMTLDNLGSLRILIEKGISQKPYKGEDKDGSWDYCPRCDAKIYKNNYCPQCGQKINWEEQDD